VIKDKIIELDIDEIKPYENNPRFNDNAVEYVKNSIKKYKYTQPIIVDKDNVVIARTYKTESIKRTRLYKSRSNKT
jgi:ParB-like chromosome segregation protein Spo0J